MEDSNKKPEKKYYEIYDIESLDTEEKCMKAFDYLGKFATRAYLACSVWTFWGAMFAVDALHAETIPYKAVMAALSLSSFYFGGDSYLKTKESLYEYQEAEKTYKKVYNKEHGFR